MPLNLDVQSVTGEHAAIQVRYTDTIDDVKTLIERSTSLGRVNNLVYKGQVLADDITVSQTALREGDRLVCTVIGGSSNRPPAEARDAAASGITSGPDKKKCFKCKTSVNLVGQSMPCRCQQVFCDRHRPPEQHQCTFDHASVEKEKLSKKLLPDTANEGNNKAAPGARRSEAGARVHREYLACHKHVRSSQLHVAAFVSALVGTGNVLYTLLWRGGSIGIYPFVFGVLGFSIATHAHTQYHNPGYLPDRNLGEGCMWSRGMRKHPVECLREEFSNAALVVIRLVTRGGTNCMTQRLAPWKRKFE